MLSDPDGGVGAVSRNLVRSGRVRRQCWMENRTRPEYGKSARAAKRVHGLRVSPRAPGPSELDASPAARGGRG